MNPSPIDRLTGLLDRFKVRARLFHKGPLCGVSRFPVEPGRGFLHVFPPELPERAAQTQVLKVSFLKTPCPVAIGTPSTSVISPEQKTIDVPP